MTAPENKVMVQGQTVASADYLNTLVQWVPDVNTLRTFIGSATMTVVLLGFNTLNDGGQGTYTWNDISTAPDDGHTIIVPQGVSQGAWIRTALNPPPVQIPSGGTINGKCGGIYVALGALTINLPLSTTLAVTCTQQVFAYGGAVTLVRTGTTDLINGSASPLVIPKGYFSTIYTDANGNFYATIQPSTTQATLALSVPPGGVSIYPGNPNNIVVNTGGSFKGIAGQFLFFQAVATNNGPTALDAGTGLIPVVANTSAGLTGAIGGEIVAGDYYLVAYNGTYWVLINPTPTPTAVLQNTPAQVAVFRAGQPGTFSKVLPASGTPTFVGFPTPYINQGGYYNQNTGAWVPPAGFVLLNAQLSFTAAVDSSCIIYIYKNGHEIGRSARHLAANAATGNNSLALTMIDYASGSDYYQVWASQQAASGTPSVVGNANAWFQGTMI